MSDASGYEPVDELYLWSLAQPAQPRLVGNLSLAAAGQVVALEYAPAWLASGFALSADTPLVPGLFVPDEKKTAAGAVDDARPDRWGERVIRRFEKSNRLSLLEFLLFAGDDRYGALSVSLSASSYVPWASAPIPGLGDLAAMDDVVRKILANEPVPELQRRLLRPGVSLGGARPKSLVSIDGRPWLVKFSEGEDMNTELIEHATMTLAARCGIEVADTLALPVAGRHAVAIRRFDRVGSDGRQRVHAISAHVALRAVGEEYGYPQLSQELRRLAPPPQIAQQQEQLFRRMVFNILVDNTDDHEKNHSLLRQADGNWLLAPAYDVLPSASGLGYQSMAVGKQGNESTLYNARSQVAAFGLKTPAANAIIQAIAGEVDVWREHFQHMGVSAGDIEVLAQYIDGRLGAQRRH
jgi:serine/threonine-protein kinase HipA